jgi:hypothetical protein
LAAVAGALVVLAMALVWPTRSSDGGFAGAPGGVTVPTDDDGHPVDLPPSQPATAVLLDASGLTMRPNPVRARIVDPVSGEDIIVPLAPDSTVDTRTGAIVPRSPTTTWPISPSTSVRTTTTTVHETTSVPEETTTTTEEPTTTTEEPTTTTEEPTTVPPDTIFYG